MKTCQNCGSAVEDEAMFCNNCGYSFQSQQTQNQQNPNPNGQMPNAMPVPPVQPVVNPHDHTAEFAPEDVSDNKLYALLIYAMGIIGVVIALLAKKTNNSPYLSFHLKQGLKFIVLDLIIAFCTALLCWTCIVLIAGVVLEIILAVVKIICFIQTCRNKSVEPAIVRSFGFLN